MTSPTGPSGPSQRLLVQGWIESLGCEVLRGMAVSTEDGNAAGVIAAVVWSESTQTITHILLGQAPPTADYRLIPITLLDRLEGERLWLQAAPAQIAALPVHQPG